MNDAIWHLDEMSDRSDRNSALFHTTVAAEPIGSTLITGEQQLWLPTTDVRKCCCAVDNRWHSLI